jgi:23S rRNA (uridine2552-2'-O)-methyltransferase
LRQIDDKFNILSDAKLILDLCCSPGSWIQEVVNKFPATSIVGVDLAKMEPIGTVKFIQGDISDETLIAELECYISSRLDLVLSDCAPKLTGVKDTDYARHIFLVEKVIEITKKFLKRDGHLVCKLFDGDQTQKIRHTLKAMFSQVSLHKPKASHKKSSELYLVAKFFKGSD